MRQLVLEKIVISGFPPINKRCLWLKGNTFYYWYKGAWRSIDSEIDIDSDYIDNKVSEVVSEEIINVIGDAPEEYNTLGELAQYAAEHEIESEKRNANISANTEAIKVLEEKVATGGISAG
jgi:hypothetical protein